MSSDQITDPRSVAKPFLFDATFDIAKAVEPETKGNAAPPEPVFTPADIDQAQTQAYAEGHAEGVAEAGKETERAIADALRLILENLENAGRRQVQACQTQQEEAAALALTVVRKLMPTLAERHGLDEIETFLAECLKHIEYQSRITVRVPEPMAGEIEQRLCVLIDGCAFDGRFTVEADAAMQPGDCRIDWDEGGAERNSERFWSDIDAAVERFLHHGTLSSAERTIEPGDVIPTGPAPAVSGETRETDEPREAISEDTGAPETPEATIVSDEPNSDPNNPH